MKLIFTLLAACGLCATVSAQNVAPSCWTPVEKDAVILPATAERLYEPLKYSAFRLDFAAIKSQLSQAPMQETAAADRPITVMLPQADGSLEPFAVVETPVLTPRMQAKYPDIRSFTGVSLTSPGKRVKIHYSPYRGFRAMIRRADRGVEWLEPVAPGQDEYYMVFDRHDLPQGLGVDAPAISTISPEELRAALSPYAPAAENRGTALSAPVRVRVYKFACTTTVEFSQDNGGTIPSVLATVVDFTNNLNGIYESDLDIRLELVDDIESILFVDPNNNPFNGTMVEQYADENPSVLDQYLGSSSKYDIGHVFARYLGGPNAGVAGGLCCTDGKARGCSSSSPPYGDYFFGIVGQEIGHQWAAGHTWNHCDANNQFSPESACEPGSGSTIMSYAGVCGGGDNVTANVDLYYHPCSIWQINNFVENGIGNSCGHWEDIANTTPIASSPYIDNFFIPISTPFELTGSATDIDGDALTYTWDEIDTGPYTALGEAQGTSPLFRSFPPTNKPTRDFPRLLTIITNGNDVRELLPTYSRDLTFCFVVRDNHTGGGGVAYDTVAFRSTDQAGPFVVTYPTAPNILWHVGEFRTVTWNVANTDKAPVNCPAVNIRMSLNGGQTYPVMLAAGVPNTGSYCLKVPDNQTVSGRIRVEAANNIFFDISNYHVKVLAPTVPGFGLCLGEFQSQICSPETYTTMVSTGGWLGFSDAISLSASGLPAGVNATFSPAVVQPGEDAVMTIDFPAGTPEGLYDVVVNATTDSSTVAQTTKLTVVSNDFSAFALQQPPDATTGVSQNVVLRWNGVVDADAYDVQFGNSPSFDVATILATKSNTVVDTFKLPILLEKAHVYYWRVRPQNDCGEAAWSEPFVFETIVDACAVYVANDVPLIISPIGTPTIESVIHVGSGGTISDVNIKKIQGAHDFFHDLEAHLIGPDGTDVLLWKDKCSQIVPAFNIGFDDVQPGIFPCPPPNSGTPYNPFGQLSSFNGKNATGDWKLRIKDNVATAGGQINGFEIELCSDASNALSLTNNNPMSIENGTNLALSTALLLAEEPNHPADQLTYTLITTPTYGRLEYNWSGELLPGAQFTQADIDNGAIRYFEYGGTDDTDHFRFAVTDGEGGFLTGIFTIQPFSVGTHEPSAALAFDLSPNPTNATAVLHFASAPHSDTRVALFDAAGRQLRNWSLASGSTTQVLDVHDLPKGVYAVTVQNAEGKTARKLVVQ